MTLKPRSIFLRLSLLLVVLSTAIVIHSCRKDNNNDQEQSESQVDKAKVWYENTYPLDSKANGNLQTQDAAKNHDLTQWVKPDWQHSNSYVRNGQEVIEMPVDPDSKFASSVKLDAKRFNPKYSKSYYLIIRDSTKYNAYILTIVADSSYLGNDLTKLDRNTYRKHEADFTGSILYFTPKGEYLGGYGYNNGKLMAPGTNATKTDTQQIQSVKLDGISTNVMKQECTEWYIVYYKNGEYWYDEYLTTTCRMVDDGTTPGSGGGPPPPPPPCPAGSHPGPPVVRPCLPPAVESVDNPGRVVINYVPPPPPPGDDGLPPPPSQSCSVDPPREPCPDITNEVKDPCLNKMVNSTINKNVTTVINGLIQKVFGGSAKVNVTYSDALTLPSGYKGYTPPPASLDANGNLTIKVYLNQSELSNSSQEFISTVIIHESLHAYLTTIGNLGQLQHNTIASTFASQMALDLRQMYPGLPEPDATNLAWAGLQSTPDFQNGIGADITKLGAFDAAQTAYSTGIKGSQCK